MQFGTPPPPAHLSTGRGNSTKKQSTTACCPFTQCSARRPWPQIRDCRCDFCPMQKSSDANFETTGTTGVAGAFFRRDRPIPLRGSWRGSWTGGRCGDRADARGLTLPPAISVALLSYRSRRGELIFRFCGISDPLRLRPFALPSVVSQPRFDRWNPQPNLPPSPWTDPSGGSESPWF